MADLTSATTVADLVAFIDRQRMALTEAGRPDLAAVAHVVITAEGEVRLRCAAVPVGDSSNPTVLKAIALDPSFEVTR